MQRALYPFLLCFYFVLFIFSENLGEAYLDETFRSLAAVLLATTLFVVLFSLTFRSVNKGGFIATLLLTLLFIHSGIEDILSPVFTGPSSVILGLEIALLIALAVATLKKVKDWPAFNKTLNVMAGVLLLLTLYQIGDFGLSDDGAILKPNISQKLSSAEGYTLPENPPNIFYILVDGYARSDTIKNYFSYDNSGFINFLQTKGFQVADNSYANYYYTYLATNAVLNFEYIADGDGINWAASDAIDTFLEDKLFNNQAGAIFNSLGYRTVTLRSVGNYIGTASAEDITASTRWLTLNEFDTAVLDTTLLPSVFDTLNKDWSHRKQVDFVIAELARQSAREGPMFVLAHIMAPHHPFLYDRNGNRPDISKRDFGKADHLAEDVRGYGDQVHYLNTRLEPLIEQILANSTVPPIIVLQGDHGLRITLFANKQVKQTGLEDACLGESLPILNAMYLPGAKGPAAFHNSISPVNTFRLILDTYFGGNLGLLEDRSFFPVMNKKTKMRDFIEVTELQNTCSSEWTKRFDAVQKGRPQPQPD
jgi:hypothetical protein